MMLNFGDALSALKAGSRVCREGWNGKGMWLCLSGPLGGRKINSTAFWGDHTSRFADQQPERAANVLPCIVMKTAGNEIQMGWVPSQMDLMADDWVVLA